MGEACVVCGDPVPEKRRKTCSTECSRIYRAARHLVSDEAREAQRLSMARSILSNRERYGGTAKWRWAERVLSGALKAQRRYHLSGSEAAHVAAEAGFPIPGKAGTPLLPAIYFCAGVTTRGNRPCTRKVRAKGDLCTFQSGGLVSSGTNRPPS